MKVNEYLSAKRAAGEILEKKYKKASKKFPVTTVVFFILIAGMFFGGTRLPKDPVEAIDTNSFTEYERTSLGNAVINTLNNGIIADNGIGHTEIVTDGTKVVSSSGECLLPADASNINITDKGVFFRDNGNMSYCFLKYGESYKDYSNDINNKDDGDEEGADADGESDSAKEESKDKIGQIILDEPCGNCIVSDNDTLYLIRFSKDSHVYSYDLNGQNEKTIIDEPVRSFAVLENAIFYLDYNNTLIRSDKEGKKEYSIERVDKFFLNGDLYVQNNDKVIKLNLNNENGEVVAEGIEDLLGVTDTSIYYLKDNKVYERDINSDSENIFSQGKNYYEGVYKNNGKVIAVGEDL